MDRIDDKGSKRLCYASNMEEMATPPPPRPARPIAMDVVPPRKLAPAPSGPVAVEPAPPNEDKAAPAPKEPGNGVGMAIFATVIIVLSLATLATYAYIKTQK